MYRIPNTIVLSGQKESKYVRFEPNLNNKKPSKDEFSKRVRSQRAQLGYFILRTGQVIRFPLDVRLVMLILKENSWHHRNM